MAISHSVQPDWDKIRTQKVLCFQRQLPQVLQRDTHFWETGIPSFCFCYLCVFFCFLFLNDVSGIPTLFSQRVWTHVLELDIHCDFVVVIVVLVYVFFSFSFSVFPEYMNWVFNLSYYSCMSIVKQRQVGGFVWVLVNP